MSTDENDDRQDDDEREIVEREGTVTVPIGEPDDDDGADDGADEGGGTPEERQSRAEKKRQRQGLREELAARDRTINELREKSSGFERTINELRQSVEQTRQHISQARRDDNDPLEEELNQVLDQQQELADLITAKGGKMTADEERRFNARARELRMREGELYAARHARQNAPRPDPVADIRAAVKGAYPEVFANPRAFRAAKGHMELLIAKRGEPNNAAELHALMRDACEEAKKDFGMGRPAPTDTERRKFNGTPRGGTGGGRPKNTDITMTEHDVELANTAYSHIKDPKERMKKWASKAGKRLADKKVGAKR